MRKVYFKYFLIRFLELVFIGLVGVAYTYVFSNLFEISYFFYSLFFLPFFIYLFHIVFTALSKERFARYIEKYNNLDEYFLSFVELQNKKTVFMPLLEKRLKNLLKDRKIRIPFSAFVLRVGLYTIVFLLLFVILFTHFSSIGSIVYFDRIEYVSYPNETVYFVLKGKKMPDSVFIYFKGKDTLKVPVKDKIGEFISPKKPGIYVIVCKECMPSRLKVVKKPEIKVKGYVKNLSTKWRKLENVDYILSGSEIKMNISFKNTDSAILSYGKIHLYKDTTLSFKIISNSNISVSLYKSGIRIDTLLYTLYVINDEPPKVVILYPPQNIVPVMDDTVYIVSYVFDDIGLLKSSILLFRGEHKKLLYVKRYNKNIVSDTLRLAIEDVLSGYDEAKVKIIAEDISGKVGYVELTYKKPSYEDRLKEFMAMRDSIAKGESGMVEDDELQKYSFQLMDRENVNLEEREKIKMSLEKTYEELKKTQKKVEEVQKIMENLKDIAQDKELENAMKEFSKTFSELLKEYFKDILKEISHKNAKIDTMSREGLKKYIEDIKSKKKKIARELKKLSEFLKLVKEELDREEFVSRFEKLKEKEQYLMEKTKYFENIKILKKEQMEILKELRQLKKLSPELWGRYRSSLEDIQKRMKDVSLNLEEGKRKISLKKEKSILKDMAKIGKSLKEDIQRRSEERKRVQSQEIERLKWDLYFLNLASRPDMKTHERGLYKESLKLILSYVDSFDAITYMTIFKAVALLKLSSNFVMANPKLGYGLVNQSIYFLLNSQRALQQGGGAGSGKKLRQMLQKLLSKQSMLTKQTGGMLPLPLPTNNNMLSLLSEYGKMQEKLRKMAEQLAKLSGDKGIKGEIKNALKEMKKAEEELKSGHLSHKTVEHQRRALKHLLRAYRSIRKKDVSRKRISTPGKSFVPEDVPIPKEVVINRMIGKLLKYMLTEGKVEDTFLKTYIENLKKHSK